MSELRKLAEAATSGIWKWAEGTPIITRQWNGKDCAIAAVDYKGLAWHEDGNCAGRESGANAAYIAAANPAVVIGLLDEIDRLRTEAVAADIRIANDSAAIAGLTAERDALARCKLADQDAYVAMRVQRDAALNEAKRLDFMIENRAYVVSDESCCDGYWLHYAKPDGTTWVQASEHETPRAAIDAAMKGEQP